MGGVGNRELLFSGYRISVLQDEKFLEILIHNNVNILNTTELNT